MVAEDYGFSAEFGAGLGDAVVKFGGGHTHIRDGEFLPADACVELFGEGFGGEVVVGSAERGLLDFGDGYCRDSFFNDHSGCLRMRAARRIGALGRQRALQ